MGTAGHRHGVNMPTLLSHAREGPPGALLGMKTSNRSRPPPGWAGDKGQGPALLSLPRPPCGALGWTSHTLRPLGRGQGLEGPGQQEVPAGRVVLNSSALGPHAAHQPGDTDPAEDRSPADPQSCWAHVPWVGTFLQAPPPWVCPLNKEPFMSCHQGWCGLLMRTFTEIATQLALPTRVTRNSRFFCHGDLVEGLLIPILGSPLRAGWGGGH